MNNAQIETPSENKDRNVLIEQAVSAIMELTEEERLRVLSKYAERYGVTL